MKDEEKTREQLIDELALFRRRLDALEVSDKKLKEAEVALREAEKRYRILSEISVDGASSVLLSADGTFTREWVTESFDRLMGYSQDDVTSIDDYLRIIHPEDLPIVTEKLVRLLTGETVSAEVRFLMKDGEVRWIRDTIRPVWDEKEGRVMRLVSAVRDITERKRAEEALRYSEERYRLLAENARDVIWTMDMDLNYTYFSPSIESQRGFSADEAMALGLADHLTPASYEIVTKVFAEELEIEESGEADPERTRTLELAFTCKDGSTLLAEVKIVWLRDREDQAVGLMGVSRDITERRRAEKEKDRIEAQLFQVQRMEAVGLLAGGVAHDFNNLLMIIQTLSYKALRGMPEDAPPYEDLNAIRKTCLEAGLITKKLLNMGRRQPLELSPVSLNNVLSEILKILDRLIGDRHTIVTDFDKDLEKINANSGGIEQVILNLVLNAKDAMKEGGTITVRTENVLIEEGYCETRPDACPGESVCLVVEDCGEGMDEERSAQIFEPFFSTKGPDGGNGLGLSVVDEIVKRHKGWIGVESRPGEGTTFRIFFPAMTGEPEGEDGSKTSRSTPGSF